MKVKLAVAFAVLLFASTVRADTVQTADGSFVIPDGSTITGETQSSGITGPVYTLDYSFADGTGSATWNSYFGYSGEILFSTPVSDLSFGWQGSAPLTIYDNAGDSFADETGPGSGDVTFSGADITELFLGGDESGALSGISSLAYTEDVVEPSTLPLLGLGLIALVALSRRKVSCCG